MPHSNNIMARSIAVGSAAVLATTFALGFSIKAFADTDPINVNPSVDILGGPFAYTGEQICPTALLVTAEVDGDDVILQNNTDYTFECGENIEIGATSGVINLFDVEGSDYVFDDMVINFPIWEHLQDISYEDTAVEVTYGDDNFTNELTETEVHGAISYSSSDEEVATVDADGEVTILMPGDTVITAVAAAADGYGEGVASYTLTVNKKSVSIVDAVVEGREYDGTNIVEVSDITLDDDDLSEGVDFEAVGTMEDANIGADKVVNVTIRLYNDAARFYALEGSFEAAATITAFDIDMADANLTQTEYTYSGAENKPGVSLVAMLDGEHDTPLVENEDFAATYPVDMVSAGEKTVIVRGTGNFAGEIELYYDVYTYTLMANNVSLEYNAVRYDGTAKTPAVTVKIGDFEVDPNEYEVAYNNNDEVGTATVRVTAKDDVNIDSFAEKNFEIIAKEVLDISGIDNQTVTYTGEPVVLEGTLAVGENTDNITVNDLTTTWYDEDMLSEIDQPIDAGAYVVAYSYNGENYQGTLLVNFTIAKAASPTPAEMTEGLSAEQGTYLDAIDGDRTDGFYWVNGGSSVAAGNNVYPATYTYNDDEDNYTTLNLNVPVYGFALINVDVEVDGDGGDVEYPYEAYEGEQFEITFKPAAHYEIRKVLLNGIEVTHLVEGNKLAVTASTTDVDVLVSFRKIYNVIEGAGMNYVMGKGMTASFRFDVDYEKFLDGGKVYVDGMLIGEGYYKHTSGSTIITLSDDLIAYLGEGSHTIAVVFNDGGIARANFSVSNAGSPVKTPDTGFFTNMDGGAKMASALSVIALAGGAVIVARKKFARSKIDFDKK